MIRSTNNGEVDKSNNPADASTSTASITSTHLGNKTVSATSVNAITSGCTDTSKDTSEQLLTPPTIKTESEQVS